LLRRDREREGEREKERERERERERKEEGTLHLTLEDMGVEMGRA
jgi:hypothetical protein